MARLVHAPQVRLYPMTHRRTRSSVILNVISLAIPRLVAPSSIFQFRRRRHPPPTPRLPPKPSPRTFVSTVPHSSPHRIPCSDTSSFQFNLLEMRRCPLISQFSLSEGDPARPAGVGGLSIKTLPRLPSKSLLTYIDVSQQRPHIRSLNSLVLGFLTRPSMIHCHRYTQAAPGLC